jgi:hypothetical protein
MKLVYVGLFVTLLAGSALGQASGSPLAPPKPLPPGGPKTFLKIGDKAPDFALPNGDGKIVTLAEYTARSPVVLVFYRGFW